MRQGRRNRPFARKLRRRLAVESLEDRKLLATLGDTPAPETPVMQCTLRAALMETNAHAERNQILFHIADRVGDEGAQAVIVNSTADFPDDNPGDGVCSTGQQITLGEPAATMTIVPATPLPPVTDRLDLDGRRMDSQRGQWPGVAIDGANVVAGNGLEIKASQTVIHGLSVQRFTKSGVVVFEPDVVIANNHIGTDLEGTADRGNFEHGVHVDNTSRVWVGASYDDVRGNVISGNGGHGVLVAGAGAVDNVVARNMIGTTSEGDRKLPNDGSGVVIAKGAVRNRVAPPEVCAVDQDHPWICHNLISGNAETGVVIEHSGTRLNVVADNRIGTDLSGISALGNGQHGVAIRGGAEENTVHANLLSGNQKAGLAMIGSGTDENVADANLIGVDNDGRAAIPNQTGVLIQGDGSAGPRFNRIGSDGDGCEDSDEVNVVSGNRGDGIWITGVGTTDNSVSGNVIGLDSTQSLGIGNRGYGIRIDDGASANRIGLDDRAEAGDAHESNIIAANGDPSSTTYAGILISGVQTKDNIVSGNRIGTNAYSAAGLGNFGDGIRLGNGTSGNLIVAGASLDPDFFGGNVISGQGSQRPDFVGDAFHGILITGNGTDRNQVTGNRIGSDIGGTNAVANLGNGILISDGARLNQIGRSAEDMTSEATGNLIAFNGAAGVRVAGSSSKHNVIRANAIHDNGGLGIDLVGGDENGDGVTLNDSGDSDDGPNTLLNFPVIYHAAQTGTTWRYEGQYFGEGTLDVYSNASPDPSLHGEGGVWKQAVAAPGENGSAFEFESSDEIPWVSVTATNGQAGTSEFGRRISLSVDLDADTDNTGVIDGNQQEEDDELTAPGMIVMLNRDDDNENGQEDFTESGALLDGQGSAVTDDDLVPLVIRELDFDELDLTDFKVRLRWTDATPIRLWEDPQRSQRIETLDELIGEESRAEQTIYLEGIAEGVAIAKLELVSPLGTVVARDDLRVSVVNPDLTAYRPKTEEYGAPFQRWAVPEDEEIEPGVGIRRNGDDDDSSGLSDRYEESVLGENDLIEVEWAGAGLEGVQYRLQRTDGKIQVWDGEDKSDAILADAEVHVGELNPASDRELWVEWFDKGDGFSDLTLVVVDERHDRPVERASGETLRFSPFNSLVIVFGGRSQQPADPVQHPGQEGMFQTAIDLYREGYDVRMYNERTGADGDGNGLAYNEIRSGVNMRGVTHLAVLGYSHGGGSTYELSQALFENTTGARTDIVRDFSLDLTAYVDAIRDNDLGLDLQHDPENRRPINTGFHLNQYQRTGFLHGTLSNADRELDRTGLGVDHLTIDDHAAVLDEMKQEVRRRIKR